MDYAKLLLNKIIEDGTTTPLTRHNITLSDMHSDVDKAAYKFIVEYAEANAGKAPSYLAITAEVEGFEYLPEVSDSYAWLTTKIKEHSAQQLVVDWFRKGEFERKLNELGGERFINEWLPTQVSAIQTQTNVRQSVGTDIKTDVDKVKAEYERRKFGESFKIWKSKYSAIGEYVSSNLYTVFGKSGRGKSIMSLEDAIYAASQGANVLIWAMEMGWYEVLVRIYTSISGEEGMTQGDFSEQVRDGMQLPDVNMDVGFNSRDVRLGQLSEEFETEFMFFIDTMNARLKGNITVRAVDDEDFGDRTLRALSADIKTTNADYVVIDPFYYLHYEKNTSKTTGGDAANTSMQLRALAGRTQTVIVAITQADETTQEQDEDGARELELPERKDVKKTKALLEDAYLLIGVDSDYLQGRALVGVFKGRDGGEGNTTEVLYMPQYGVVKELETGEAAASEFDF